MITQKVRRRDARHVSGPPAGPHHVIIVMTSFPGGYLGGYVMSGNSNSNFSGREKFAEGGVCKGCGNFPGQFLV
jgi:hypothetical protein